MPVNFDELQETAQPKTRKSSSDRKNRVKQASEAVNQETSAIVRAGMGAITQEMHSFDNALTQIEMQAAEEMAERLLQSPFRVRAYLLENLKIS